MSAREASVDKTRTSTTGRADGRRLPSLEGLYELLNRYLLPLLLMVVIVGFSIARPTSFFTANNFRNMISSEVVVVFLAIGVTMPLIVGEFDLSIGYVLDLAQCLVVGLMIKQGLGVVPAIVITVVVSAAIGLVNGLLVVKFKINALIATLAVGSILTGAVFAYTGGQVLFQDVPSSFVQLGNRQLLGLPLPILYAAVVAAVVALFYSFIPTGRRLYGVGGNRQAAFLSGIRVDTLVIASFVGSAALSGLGGIVLAARLGSAQAGLGAQFLLPAFAAVFLGATSIRPGRFNVVGTLVAVYLLSISISGLEQVGVPSWFEYVFNGLALIVAVGASNQVGELRRRRAERQRLRAFAQDDGA